MEDSTPVSLAEQYGLAELLRSHLDMATDGPPEFAARVVEGYGMTDPARDTCPSFVPLAPWTTDELKDIA